MHFVLKNSQYRLFQEREWYWKNSLEEFLIGWISIILILMMFQASKRNKKLSDENVVKIMWKFSFREIDL